MSHFARPALVLSLAVFCAAPISRAADTPKSHRFMYVCLDRDVAVYDMDAGHKFVRWIPLNSGPDQLRSPPAHGDHGAANFRGVYADAASARLYVTFNPTDELICVDLKTDKVLWRKKYGKHVDSQAITPDGKTIYLPCREDGKWHVLDAATGDETAAIPTGGNPHNTEIGPDGSKVFMESLAHPWVFIAEAPGHEIVGKVGPFSSAVRPFSVSGDGKFVYACVNGLLGFEIGDVATGRKIARVEARRPPERQAQLPKAGSPHGCPSHGIGQRPGTGDRKEVWVADSAYGFLYAFDVTTLPAKQLAAVALFEKPEDRPEPGWVSFSLDGKLAYAPGDAIIDTDAKKVIARMPTSEKMIEINFDGDKPVSAARRMW